MKKKVWIWVLSIVGLIVISTAGLFLIFMKTTNELGADFEDAGILVQKVSEQKLGESILVTGKVIPEEEQKVFLDPENGEVHEYLVEENQQVVAGEPLFTYDASKVDAEYNKAVRSRDLIQNRLKIEQNEIATIEKRIGEVRKKVKNGDEEYTEEDINLLSKEKIQSEMNVEDTKDELASAQELINELAATKQSMTVVSKIDGIIVKVNKNVEKTEAGTNVPVIHIISSEPYKVIGTMSEFDTVKIQPGQAVTIRPKVFKDREWNGVVESVSHFPDEEGGMDDFGGGGNVTMYPFKVAITDDTSELRQGFHVSLEVNVSGDEKALAIPHMALTIDEEGLECVYVLVDGFLEKRNVQLGEMNDEFIGIVEGVADGELIVIMPDESMHDGMEVTFYDEVE
ncbi:efflux RND transporter periplasmic adaptor subunit [Sporosarcina ureilytica]|uniref:ABC transporter substrate-binding protein n=1 Tax=Sporosarcina ureilytica TaxID=298596 RepID=A0A1D8JDE9_9BACL|nr:efflux RND transporter periplasmic adaptor subunit [Sporosarcina ureilytica]AOV06736.1 ABC transporter substrate-binding protein [Sporosarcina ureilytica]